MWCVRVLGCYVKYVAHVVSAKQSIPAEEQHKLQGEGPGQRQTQSGSWLGRQD